jgi:hypothetical protein
MTGFPINSDWSTVDNSTNQIDWIQHQTVACNDYLAMFNAVELYQRGEPLKKKLCKKIMNQLKNNPMVANDIALYTQMFIPALGLTIGQMITMKFLVEFEK